ncbi:MAG: hypothetical protein CBD16_06390 [Betaproteobacteria bacterium TMED156]|nr:MAG: hypothetical protein CBD16_06390 [Betaproteobacteria bacterium TMED156]
MIFIKVPPQPSKDLITGNHQTAIRYALLLESVNINANIFTKDIPYEKLEEFKGGIILHAKKNHSVAVECQKKGIPYLLVLTGTDIYYDINDNKTSASQKCIESITGAKLIIVLQENAKKKLLKKIPNLETKIIVIYQSTNINLKKHNYFEIKKNFSVIMVGNVRKEKDTLTGIKGFMKAYKNLLNIVEFDIKLIHIGLELDKRYSFLVKKYADNFKHIEFLGMRDNIQTINLINKSDLFLNTSIIEGGCLALKEAIDLRIPSLVSDIDCHKSMLGDKYPGYYRVKSVHHLAVQLEDFISNKIIRKVWTDSIRDSPLAEYTSREEKKLLQHAINFLDK